MHRFRSERGSSLLTSPSIWTLTSLALSFFLNFSLVCPAAVITVPGNHATIQAAIDAASDGDEIIVSSGTYYENIYFGGKNIILRSTDPTNASVVAATIIDGSSNGNVVAFAGTESGACILSGFTITHGDSTSGGGISGNGTLATIQYNNISGNEVKGRGNTFGGGLYKCNGTIRQNIISGNLASSYFYNGYGGGLCSCGGTIRGNTISGNCAGIGFGRGGGLYGCGGTIEDNIISGNLAYWGGGGLYGCNGTLQNNIISDNMGGYFGGGGYACGGTIQNNIISGNDGPGAGGLYVCGGTIRQNTICGNSATSSYYGGGLSGCGGTIQNCIIWLNRGSQLIDCAPTSYCCIQDWSGGGTGNISADPQFVNPDGGDFHLITTSPCIDAGCYIAGLTEDFDGDPRPVDGVPEPRGDGSDFDIGADEFTTRTTLTVFSPYDSPVPPVGENLLTLGCLVTAYVKSPAVWTVSGTRQICAGWRGEGSVPTSGTITTTTFVLDQPSTITWLWSPQYYLTASVNPVAGGSVTRIDGTTPATGWYGDNSTATVLAVAAPYYQFDNWSGDLSGSNNPEELLMDAPKSIVANFHALPTPTPTPTATPTVTPTPVPLYNMGWRMKRYDDRGTLYDPHSSTVQSGGAFVEKWSSSTGGAWRGILSGDVDGDGKLEVVASQDNHIRVYEDNGAAGTDIDLSSWDCAEVRLLADVNGDGIDEISIGGRYTSGEPRILFYSGSGSLLKTFSRSGGYDSSMHAIHILANGDVLVHYNAGYGAEPRGVARWDYSAATELWYYDVGPAPGDTTSIADIDNDGKLEITFASNTNHNGASGCGYNNNGTCTTDGDFYTILVDEDGNERFTVGYTADGESDGALDNYLVDLNHNGIYGVLVLEGHDAGSYPGTSQVHLLNASNGSMLYTFNGAYSAHWGEDEEGAAIVDLDGNGYDEVVAGSNNGTIYILDMTLDVITSASIAGSVCAVNDVDADGELEIIVKDGAALRVLNRSLVEEWDYSVGADITSLIISDLDGNGMNELILTADKIYVLEGVPATPTPTASPTATPTPSPTPWQIVFDFVADREDWTSRTVPVAFSEPDFLWEPDYLKIISRTNTNTFGYWQCAEDAVPAHADYLYRARFTILTDVTDQAHVPQIRLRTSSLNLQEYDVLSLESAGDGGASPTTSGTDYDLYFVPPLNETAMMLAFDLLNFNPFDAAVAELSLDTVTIDRFALSALPAATLVQDYTFDSSQDGWTTGGAPIVFSSPHYIYSDGALELRATTNTNTFGYWGNNPADITIEANRLYRGTFDVRTDVTDPALVPEMRLRFNVGNLQASHTFGVSSAGDGANSPGTTTTMYDRLYFLPPANCVGKNLIISFDILNFNPGDAAPASLMLDRAIIETLSPPASP